MPLPRLQLFELEDLPWFPQAIRDLATDYLHFMERRFELHKPVVALLCHALEESALAHVVDLCSGGGGPVLALYEDLIADGVAVKFTLTDKYRMRLVNRSSQAGVKVGYWFHDRKQHGQDGRGAHGLLAGAHR